MEKSLRFLGSKLKLVEKPSDIKYSYAPLPDSGAIRLLKLSKSLLAGAKPLITLKTFKLTECPQYSALSYTWGEPLVDPPASRQNVKLEECVIHIKSAGQIYVMPVTTNLFDCLTYLTKKGFSDYLWVDALCIDQQDVDEKSSQVSNMGIIYSAAVQVIVWLGIPAMDLSDVLWIIDTFHRAIKAFAKRHGRQAAGSNWQSTDPEFYYNQLGIEDPGQRWIAYAKFFQDFRWFSRGWVFQELALAKNVVLLVGSLEVSWYQLCFVAKWIYLSGLRNTLPISDESPEWKKAVNGESSYRTVY